MDIDVADGTHHVENSTTVNEALTTSRLGRKRCEYPSHPGDRLVDLVVLTTSLGSIHDSILAIESYDILPPVEVIENNYLTLGCASTNGLPA